MREADDDRAREAEKWRDLRQQAARQAAALRDDPQERQRAEQVARDLDDLDAG